MHHADAVAVFIRVLHLLPGDVPHALQHLVVIVGKPFCRGKVELLVVPEHAAILSGGSIGTHIQMGIGDGVIPVILNQKIYSDICIVKDEEAIKVAKDLASKEGLMCGISSGTNVAAALKLAKKLGKGKTVVTVLPDTAERYFSTPLFED